MAAGVSSGPALTVHYQTPEMKQNIKSIVDERVKLLRQKEELEAKSAACAQRIAARDQEIAVIDQRMAARDQKIAGHDQKIEAARAKKVQELQKTLGFFTAQKENLGVRLAPTDPLLAEIDRIILVMSGLVEKQSQGINTIEEVKKIQPSVEALGKKLLALQKTAGSAPVKQ